MHPFFHSSPFFPFFSGQLFLCCLLEGGVWRMGPFLPNCRFEGFFSLVHAGLKIHLFDKALYMIFFQEDKKCGLDIYHHRGGIHHLPHSQTGMQLHFFSDRKKN